MKIKELEIEKFRRFEKLTIKDLPAAKLVVMAGPNGSGKSSVFDAFSTWLQARFMGINWDTKYYERDQKATKGWIEQVRITFDKDNPTKKSIYVRSAYRNDPDFEMKTLSRQGDATENPVVRRMIDQDGRVQQNYQRLASNALEDAFDREDENITLKEFRTRAIGDIKSAVARLFPDLSMDTLGNPLIEGTFRFTKGVIPGFSYKNLSGGEKAAFDLLLDMVVKTKVFDDTVYAIDEPEAHMNTRLQGALLEELYNLIPDGSQMWVATHSIGMMRKARELYQKNKGEVIFLDFEGHNYDQEVVLKPVVPSRAFWERILAVALDDLAELVAPKEVLICEGNPAGALPGKNAEHDATILATIFADEFPDAKFISGGNAKDVAADRLGFVAALPKVASGISVVRLIDRDDHAPADVAGYERLGIRVLGRRHLECYTYDDEVLVALCASVGKPNEAAALLGEKAAAMAASVGRGNAVDDVKSAAGDIYVKAKQRLALTAVGNDQMAFARATLAPLLHPGMAVYADLKKDVFRA